MCVATADYAVVSIIGTCPDPGGLAILFYRIRLHPAWYAGNRKRYNTSTAHIPNMRLSDMIACPRQRCAQSSILETRAPYVRYTRRLSIGANVLIVLRDDACHFTYVRNLIATSQVVCARRVF